VHYKPSSTSALNNRRRLLPALHIKVTRNASRSHNAKHNRENSSQQPPAARLTIYTCVASPSISSIDSTHCAHAKRKSKENASEGIDKATKRRLLAPRYGQANDMKNEIAGKRNSFMYS